MVALIDALLPPFLLIALGGLLRARRFVPDSFWPAAERLTYFITFPALLFVNAARADLQSTSLEALAGVAVATVVIKAALMGAARPLLARIDGPAYSSLFQGAIRPNTYVGLALAYGLYGEAGLMLTAISVAVVVPTVNVLSVAACLRWGAGQRRAGWRGTLMPILANPLILASLGGLAVNLLGWPLPVGLGPLLDILGRAALPLGLLAVGAGLDLRAAKRALGKSGASALGKLIVLPAISLVLGRLAGLDGLALAVVTIYAGLPTSASAYVLARQMGGDAPLMASIITVHTLTALLTLPIWAIILA